MEKFKNLVNKEKIAQIRNIWCLDHQKKKKKGKIRQKKKK